MKPTLTSCAAFLLMAVALGTIPSSAFAQRLEFEVPSVKQNVGNGPVDFAFAVHGPNRSGDRITIRKVQLYTLIFYAYQLKGNYQMVGFVPFPKNEENWYDIEARVGANATDDQIRLMLQSLLEDRFKLKLHRETRELTQYELTIGKGKPKLTPAREETMTLTIEGRSLTQRPGTCGLSLWTEGAHLACHDVQMDRIITELSGALQAPVADKTGLTGTYDLNLLYLPENRRADPNAPQTPPLPGALQEELGLRLEKNKGAMEVLVIDHLEKPPEN